MVENGFKTEELRREIYGVNGWLCDEGAGIFDDGSEPEPKA